MIVQKVLFITLSNIGDCVLTLPCLDLLRECLPQARITVVVGPRAQELFAGNPFLQRIAVFDKHAPFQEQMQLFRDLERERFDMVIDLRNSFFGLFLSARFKTSPFDAPSSKRMHKKDWHRGRVRRVLARAGISEKSVQNRETTLVISRQDEAAMQLFLHQAGLPRGERFLIIACGARSHVKRWPIEKFAQTMGILQDQYRVRLVVVGDAQDRSGPEYLHQYSGVSFVDVTGKTSLLQLAYLMKVSMGVITNDSATLHIASYLNLPVVALFGPTDEYQYGPWSDVHQVVKKEMCCRPCGKAQCRYGHLQCMTLIDSEDVVKAAGEIFFAE